MTATLGTVGVLLVLFRLIGEPGSSALEVQIGAWIALAATVAITAGGWLSLDERARARPAAGRRAGAAPDARPSRPDRLGT